MFQTFCISMLIKQHDREYRIITIYPAYSQYHSCWWPGPRFNMKMSSYQYRKSHCGDKTVVRSSYLHNGISYTVKMSSLYWIRALVIQSTSASAAMVSTYLFWVFHFQYHGENYTRQLFFYKVIIIMVKFNKIKMIVLIIWIKHNSVNQTFNRTAADCKHFWKDLLGAYLHFLLINKSNHGTLTFLYCYLTSVGKGHGVLHSFKTD